MRKLLRKLFLMDWNPQKVLIYIPDKKRKLYNGTDKVNCRKIKKWKRRIDIERNYYKNNEND